MKASTSRCCYGAVSFIVGAIGGLVWIFSAEKAAQGAAPIEVPK